MMEEVRGVECKVSGGCRDGEENVHDFVELLRNRLEILPVR